MKTIVLFFLLLLNITFAQSLDDLLQEYQDASEKSLHTLDERMGHVVVYSQQDIRRMQYNTLDDILKELPRKISIKTDMESIPLPFQEPVQV